MKTIASASLADIELELTIRAVTDDLAAFSDRLTLSAGAEKGYASFAAETHQVGEIAERAIGHAVEISRFLALAGTSERAQVAFYLNLLIGLSVLNAASTIAVALASPRLAVDFAARRRVLGDVIAAVCGDAEFGAAARKAFAHGDVGDVDVVETVFHAATVPAHDDARDGRPTVLGLEQGLSLMAFVRELATPAILVERAALQLDDADGFVRAIEQDADLDPERLDRLQRACHGANLLAAADLARACLIDAVTAGDQDLRARGKELAQRLVGERLRDIVIFADAMADRIRELRHMQQDTAGRFKPL
ncbi:hypothetical protein J2X48_000859 [Bosea sp. BE271]|uniref:hypothetical protein n=1 Tax=Bosea TaxID=85413 RepID=UPI0028647673|nr:MULTISPECIES: hypothetical protein [Bosea]MDR6826339.1 hypothetical protein [Bosea robiniae]MDR6893049.1 hypothetical protein [Bosea sp. BE109]MDR7137253.1 hypothetical protein [Bosea sp. BE168]MDR7173953.1 hypothetical protein [Bosea sp. BE271]